MFVVNFVEEPSLLVLALFSLFDICIFLACLRIFLIRWTKNFREQRILLNVKCGTCAYVLSAPWSQLVAFFLQPLYIAFYILDPFLYYFSPCTSSHMSHLHSTVMNLVYWIEGLSLLC